jgi:hypothetical protein
MPSRKDNLLNTPQPSSVANVINIPLAHDIDFHDGDDGDEKPLINTFDIDGVIWMGDDFTGVWPGPEDIIITGRSITQAEETLGMLHSRGIFNQVFFNPLRRSDPTYSREASGKHKVNVLKMLLTCYDIGVHFEDDPVQINELKNANLGINIVHLQHTLTVK